MNYPDNGLSVGVHMTAWNPCIPLDEDNSGIPVIVFQFDVSNPSNEAVQVSSPQQHSLLNVMCALRFLYE